MSTQITNTTRMRQKVTRVRFSAYLPNVNAVVLDDFLNPKLLCGQMLNLTTPMAEENAFANGRVRQNSDLRRKLHLFTQMEQAKGFRNKRTGLPIPPVVADFLKSNKTKCLWPRGQRFRK